MSLRDHSPVWSAAAVACALAAWPAAARAQSDYDEDRPAFVLYLSGGAFSPLAHLDDGDRVKFTTGFAASGGTAYRVNRFLALRGNFTFTRSEVRDESGRPLGPIATNSFNRFLYDGDVQLRYPLHDGMTPYVFLGGGGVTVQRDVARNRAAFTTGAGKVGGGLSYQLPDSGVGLHVEFAGWIYKWDRYGYDNLQFDTTLSAGISYRFHF